MDGRLTPADTVGLELHLERCRACARAAERLERAWGRLERLTPDAAAPDAFASVLEGALGPRSRHGWLDPLLPRGPLRPAWALAVAASIVASSAMGVALGRRLFDPPTRAVSPEALALSDGFGVLPFGSPAAGVVRALEGRTE